MPEHLTPEQDALARRTEDFVRDALVPLTDAHADEPMILRREVIKASRDAGFFTMTQPRDLGGSAASTLDLVIVREGLARSGLSARRWVFGPGAGVLAGMDGELRAQYLEPVIRGEKRSAFAFTDARESTTVAVQDGDCWRVTGIKSYVTGGADADFFTLVARIADPDGTPGKGAVLLVVDAGADGMEVSAPFKSMDGSHHVALMLEDVFVPITHVVGEPGQGLPRAARQIGDVRIALAAEACGLMAFALEHLEERLGRPHHGGGTLGDREGVRMRFADARIEAFAARSMLYRTARIADSGENCINEGIATKVYATEAAGRVIDTALQLEGGSALIVGHPLERLYREVRALRLAEGASDVLRLNLARGRLELGKGRL